MHMHLFYRITASQTTAFDVANYVTHKNI